MTNYSHIKRLLLAAILLPITVSSLAYDFKAKNIFCNKLSENTVEVTYENKDYKDKPTSAYSGVFEIPSEVSYMDNTYKVVAIGSYAFCYCQTLESVSIPEGVTTIGNDAFDNCTELDSVSIPSTIIRIEENAFYGCKKLKSVNIPDIKAWCNIYFKGFFDSSNPLSNNADLYLNGELVTSLDLSLEKISDYAFEGCRSLRSLRLSVEEVGEGAFVECCNLDSIIISHTRRMGCYAFYHSEHEYVACLEAAPPICCGKTFEQGQVIYVPKKYLENYTSSTEIYPEDWSYMYDLKALSEKCSTPTISFDNQERKLKFECATEGVEYVYSITSTDMASLHSSSGDVPLDGIYEITVYAKAEDMDNSETATALFCWVNKAEDTSIISANADRGVIVSSNGENINISGTVAGETIDVYNVGGSKIKSVKASGSETTIGGLSSGNVYIIKIGGKNVKMAL